LVFFNIFFTPTDNLPDFKVLKQPVVGFVILFYMLSTRRVNYCHVQMAKQKKKSKFEKGKPIVRLGRKTMGLNKDRQAAIFV
jgi:hypothetical protein